MALNFNIAPYYDDFDPYKNFHRILFKPGSAVQARELTQSQTILQDQISKFASSIFSQNTPISGGRVTVNLRCDHLKLNLLDNDVAVVAENFKNKIIQDSTGTILAKVIETAESTGTDGELGDYPTLILSYLSGQKFSDGMRIYTTDNNFTATSIGSVGGTSSIGPASVVSITNGVFYVVKGYNISNIPNEDGSFSKYTTGNFVSNLQQTIILDKYSNTPTYRVGLVIDETIVDYIDDTSLLDPALGAPNYQAPGSDRYKINLSLTTLPLQLGDDEGFIELLRLESGVIVKQIAGTEYSNIDDYFAKRTYDTNGDFIVKDFNLDVVANTVNSGLYDIKMGRGSAYVRGYKVENPSDIVLTNSRARTTETQNNTSVFVNYGSYFYVDNVGGVFDVSTCPPVDLHLVANSSINTTNNITYNSTLVGSGYIRNLDFDVSPGSNTSNWIYKSYVYDINTNVLSANVVSSNIVNSSIVISSPNGKFSTVSNSYYGVTLTVDSGPGKGYSGRVISYNGSTSTFTVTPNFVGGLQPTSASTISIRPNIKDVESIQSVSSIGTNTIVASSKINTLLGKNNSIDDGDTQYFNTTNPELLWTIGQNFVASVTDANYFTSKVFRNKAFSSTGGGTELSLSLPLGLQNSVDFEGGVGTLSPESAKENYIIIVNSTTNTGINGKVGSIMDFYSSGNTISISSDKNTLTLNSTKYVTPLTVTVLAKVSVTRAEDSTILKTKTLVKGNTSIVSIAGSDGIISSNTYVDLTYGQVYIKNVAILKNNQSQSLYVNDVKKIVKIIDTLSPAATPTVSMLSSQSNDITNNFIFNNGQKDSLYDHASITLKSGAPIPKGNILVVFDYYRHSGGDGYFTIQSYVNESYPEIPSYVSKRGTRYNLSDSIDFRPSRVNGTSSYTLEYTASPLSNDTGVYIPQDMTNWTGNYSYYLGRRDKLILSRDRSFQLVRGTPSVNPTYPIDPDGCLVLANLSHDPYTAYLPSETPLGKLPNLSLEKVTHKRWTMSDITGLQTRINNIEYYTSLSLLENQAQNMQITDANGLNRFKNGILVDDFSSFAVVDTTNLDFTASIDKVSKRMSCAQDVDNYDLQPVDQLSTYGKPVETTNYIVTQVGQGSNYISLPYTGVELFSQKLASNTVNLNPFGTTYFEGACSLNPPMDNWVDNKRQPDLLVIDPNIQIYQQSDTLNILNVGNWQTIPGTERSSTNSWRVSGGTAFQTNTYASQQLNTTLGYWTNVGSTYNQVGNGYLTDVSILPFIRSQNIVVRAKGLKVNTPIKCWFDNQNVSNNITSPDIVELTNVTGKFSEDDIIGYYDTDVNKFYPLASVVSVYEYPKTSDSIEATANVRLYITGNYDTSHDISTNEIRNSRYDINGNYVSSTGYGVLKNSKLVDFHLSGKVAGVAPGGFTDIYGNSITFVNVSHSSSRVLDFARTYGIWTDVRGASAGLDTGTSYFDVPNSGTYYFFSSALTINHNVTVVIDGSNVINLTNTTSGTHTSTLSLTKGTHSIRVVCTYNSTSQSTLRHFAYAISNSTFSGTGATSGTLYATSRSINLNPPLNAGTRIIMPDGGPSLYVGVSKIGLSGLTPNANTAYVGSKIKVTATRITFDSLNRIVITPTVQSSYITSFDGQNSIATISPPVNVSMGRSESRGDITSTYSIEGTSVNYKKAMIDGGTPALSTDENGNFFGIFTIPDGTFKTGERNFRIDNRLIDGDPQSSTTWAESVFTASGLATRSQALNFAPSIVGAKSTMIRTETRTNTLIASSTRIQWDPPPSDPVAQTFLISKENFPNGLFLKSTRFFFKTKPTDVQTPVTLSIVATDNGYPSGEALDNSIVTVYPNDIKISDNPQYLDSNTYTEFAFSAPVYLQPNILYAFILRSQSTDYNIYIASQNATAIPSSVKNLPTDATPTTITKIASLPFVGSLFESQNGITWTAEQSSSMMMYVERCKFDITKNPKIPYCVPKYLPKKSSTSQLVNTFYSIDSVSNIDGNYSKTDEVFHELNLTTTDLVPTGTSVSYTYKSTLNATKTFDDEKSVSPGRFGCPTLDNIYLNDGKGERVLQANNSNSFYMFTSLSSSVDELSPIVSTDGLSLYTIQKRINNLELSNNTIVLLNGGLGYNAMTTSVSISSPDLSGGQQAYASANIAANGIIDQVFVTYPGSGYLNPPTISVVDANSSPGTGATISTISEFSPSGGNAACRYITKKVTLDVGNDSEDLRVYLTSYKPLGTDILVFCKLLNRNDAQNFEDGNWQLLTCVNNPTQYSLSRENMIEYVYAPGVNNTANNQIEYTNVNGVTYTSFNQFAIKIILTTSDKTNVPEIKDIRCLALPSGKGI